MTRKMMILMLGACLAAVLVDRPAFARGFGGGRRLPGRWLPAAASAAVASAAAASAAARWAAVRRRRDGRDARRR